MSAVEKKYVLNEKTSGGGLIERYSGTSKANGLAVHLYRYKNTVGEQKDSTIFAKTREVLNKFATESFSVFVEALTETGENWIVQQVPGYPSLEEMIRQDEIDWPDALDVAHSLASALDRIHVQNLTHGHLSARSLFWDHATKTLKISNLGQIDGTHEKSEAGVEPDVLLNRAPEAMNPSGFRCSYLQDWYSLGMILYRLINHRHPYEFDNLTELAECHQLREIGESNFDVPPGVHDLMVKLTAKNPIQRFKSGASIKREIEFILGATGDSARANPNADFNDIPTQYLKSDKYFGRIEELGKIAHEFETINSLGLKKIILVGGYSGIGKTEFVKKFLTSVDAQSCWKLAGKFEQYNVTNPYFGWIQVLRRGIAGITAMDGKERSTLVADLKVDIGEDLPVYAQLVPEIAVLIEVEDEDTALSNQALKTKLLRSIRNFFAVVMRHAQVLILFLDDLQWMDGPSFELLGEILEDENLGKILIICTYRSNEVEPMSSLDKLIRHRRPELVNIQLNPLDKIELKSLVDDTFANGLENSGRLAEVLREKTDGNPFFSNQYLQELIDARLLVRDLSKDLWTCDLSKIKSRQITENVVELLQKRISLYPAEIIDLLKSISALAGRVPLQLLADLSGQPCGVVEKTLAPVLQDGLLSRILETEDDTGNSIALCFTHDRIEQAIYSLMEADEKAARHLEFGLKLMDSADGADRHLFLTADQLHKGLDDCEEYIGNKALIRLFKKAADRARLSVAYRAACTYLKMAHRLLEPGSWNTDHRLTHAIYRDFADVQYQLGDFEASKKLIGEALRQPSTTEIESAELLTMLIVQNTLQGDYTQAVAMGRDAIAILEFRDVSLPVKNFSELREKARTNLNRVLAERGMTEVKDIFSLEAASDPTLICLIKVLVNLIPPSFFVEPKLNHIISTTITTLSVENGITEDSLKGFVCYGGFLAKIGYYREGYEYGVRSVETAEAREYKKVLPRVLYTHAGALSHWMEPLTETRKIVDYGYQLCTTQGETDYAGYLLTLARCQNEYFLDTRLEDKIEEYKAIYAVVTKTSNSLGQALCLSALAVAEFLAKGRKGKHAFDSSLSTEKDLIGQIDLHTHFLSKCFYYVINAEALYFCGEYNKAASSMRSAIDYQEYLSTEMPLAMLSFWSSMIMLKDQASWGELGADKKADLDHHLQQFTEWAELCPANFAHFLALIEGEIQWVKGNISEAAKLWDKAAQAAVNNGFGQYAALAYVKLAESGALSRDAATEHLEMARQVYEKMGATTLTNTVKRKLATRTKAISGQELDFENDEAWAPATVEFLHTLSQEAHLSDQFRLIAGHAKTLSGASSALVLSDGNAYGEPAEESSFEGRFPGKLAEYAAHIDSDCISRFDFEELGLAEAFFRNSEVVDYLIFPLKVYGHCEGLIYLEDRTKKIELAPQVLTVLKNYMDIATSLICGNKSLRKLSAAKDEHGETVARLKGSIANLEGQVTKLNKLTKMTQGRILDLLYTDDEKLQIHRQEIAILFSDLRNYSDFSYREEPEYNVSMLEAYHEMIGRLVEKYSATIDHKAGDGVMVFFNDPIELDEPKVAVKQAVDFGLELMEEVQAIISRWRYSRVRLGLGIGISYGYASMGLVGYAGKMDYIATGRQVNLASRLCDEAKLGEILLDSKSAQELTGYELSDPRSVRLKGFQDEIVISSVLQKA